ncbi:peptidylprolyl isomerase [bacterium]|nr:peptidylprolyl isomerase [bacterium]
MERSRLLCIILGIVVLVETVLLLRPTPDPIVAKFSGEIITRETLSDKLIELYGRELLQEMITDRLIDKSLAQAKIETTPQELNRWVADYKKRPDAQEIVFSKQLDEDKLKENLKRTVGMYKLAMQDVPETERQKYFSQHKSNFAEMELRAILLGSEKEAKDLLNRIKGEDSFATMAMVHSLDLQTRDIGGSMGRVTRSELEEGFDPLSVEELFKQKVGTVSKPIEASSGGWYIFFIKSRTVDYESLRLRVLEAMATERMTSFLERLKRNANVEILLDNPQSKEKNKS